MRQLLAVVDQVVNVDIAVVLLQKGVFLQLVSVEERSTIARLSECWRCRNQPVGVVVVMSELQNEVLQLSLNLCTVVLTSAITRLEDVS